jgi:hypothetical protein
VIVHRVNRYAASQNAVQHSGRVLRSSAPYSFLPSVLVLLESEISRRSRTSWRLDSVATGMEKRFDSLADRTLSPRSSMLCARPTAAGFRTASKGSLSYTAGPAANIRA